VESTLLISESQIAAAEFDANDAIIVSDGIQVQWLARAANQTLRSALFCPVSLQAYAAVLRLGWTRSRCYFHDVEFQVCNREARKRWRESSHLWLKELGLEFTVDGIDLAELDASCQFLLFLHAAYIEQTARNLMRSLPPEATINIVSAAKATPLDFYFDSDVSSAVLRYVGEELKRKIRMLMMNERDEYVLPGNKSRPMLWGIEHSASEPALRAEPKRKQRFGRYRVGFAPATVANAEQILIALRELECEPVIFPSAWDPAAARRSSAGELTYCLSAAPGPWSSEITTRLCDLRDEISTRSSRSTLPGCIIRNPYMDFQWDYVIRKRWLAYANMIFRAAEFAKAVPLDLLIHADHFTAEAAILARMYRKRKARILVSPHSAWPVDSNWALHNHPSDMGMTASHSAAENLKALSGMAKVFVAGGGLTRPYQSLLRAAQLRAVLAAKRRAVGNRKIVLIVANALELDSVPFVDLAPHFKTLSVLRLIPERLMPHVFVAVRPKPGTLGGDSLLFRQLCGFSEEAVSLTEDLTFVESVKLADCVLGVNLPTSAYFEVLEENVPLLHVQTAQVAALHPDLPHQIVSRVTKDEDIWPAVESLLFDSAENERIKRTQQQFVCHDRKSEFAASDGPVESVIRQIRDASFASRFRNFLGSIPNGIVSWLRADGFKLKEHLRAEARVDGGFIDDVLFDSQDRYVLTGWAADLNAAQPAVSVHAFIGDKWKASCRPTMPRPDVAKIYANQNLTNVGFSLPLKLSDKSQLHTVALYAELHNGRFAKLRSDIFARINAAEPLS
jgi:hypothetical protein